MTNTYSMSFTSGTLLVRESLIVAQAYAELGDWVAVRERIASGNRLQMRTVNAAKRIFREVSSRLRCLTTEQRQLLIDAPPVDQKHLLWLAVCKRYRFIYDFATDVIHDKFLRGDLALTYDDYDAFFSRKAAWHTEVDRVAPSTRAKQRQVIFKMLREAELLTPANQIVPVWLSDAVIHAIEAHDARDLTIFPVAPTLIQESDA